MMKMTKRLLTALLSLTMLFSLAACGGSDSSGGATSSDTAPTGESAGERKALRVAMSADYAPFDWLQSDDSNGAVKTSNGSYMNGYDVLMAKRIADELDMDLEITQVEWDGLILSITTGKVDCAIAGMSITSERMQSVDFSDPYYNADLVVMVDGAGPYAGAKSLDDLAGTTLTSQLNTVWYDVIDQVPDATKGAGIDNFAAMISAVNAGKIDGFVCDNPSGKSILMSNPDLKMLDFADGVGFQVSNEETDLGIPTQKGNTELVEKINAVLAKIPQEERDAMMDQAVASQPVSAG